MVPFVSSPFFSLKKIRMQSNYEISDADAVDMYL